MDRVRISIFKSESIDFPLIVKDKDLTPSFAHFLLFGGLFTEKLRGAPFGHGAKLKYLSLISLFT